MKKRFDLKLVKRLYAFIRPNRKYLFLSLFFSLVSVLSSLFATVLAGAGVDCIVGAGEVDFERLGVIAAVIGVTVAVIFAAEWLQNIFTQKLAYKTVRDIRNGALETLQKVPLSYIDTRDKGDILSRVVTDVTEISDGLLLGFTQLFNGVVTIAATLVIMLALKWQIALVVGLFTPLSLLIANYVAKHTAAEFKKQAAKRGEMTALVDEMVGNQKVVKAFLQEKNNEEKFGKINAELQECGVKATFFSSLPNPSTRFVNNIIYIAVGLIGALMVIGNPAAFSVGTLTAFLIYAGKYAKPFNEISGVATELQSAFTSARRVFEVLDAEQEEPDSPAAEVLRAEGDVALEHVKFSYNKNVELIRDLNLRVAKGERIAIVGPTGCGKTTIINLLMRFYDVDGGRISVDGKNIENVTRNSLRGSYGMVLQETWIKKGTVKENIAYGRPSATEEEVVAAAKNAHAHGFIRRLPQGYDTVIGDDAGGISEGQKQLLCIARIMLDLPNMLILDEATSSIDTRTEIKIQRAFDAMMEGRTSFVVAHRLSTIEHADKILVMKAGDIIEQGTHAELLQKRGFYYELYNAQFAKV
ncbi:MAG: sugar ABC transporter ATP-binding protein [Bacillota bacterium]|nr:MAG: sugar ABC transporter ATP-binding protein [Bacillota bacterium]